ncbi:MAG: Mannose-1-phosphate guanylyltransferase 1 [Sodalis sp.]|nr:MAG: Mannose-1-phosphate guanylyltransferase 1 [Sodalis sp.]
MRRRFIALSAGTSLHLVTFGIVPTMPETEYGYIHRGKAQNDTAVFQAHRFVEKPDRTTAEGYIASGEYYWNSGMFLFRAKKYLSKLGKFRPDILAACGWIMR